MNPSPGIHSFVRRTIRHGDGAAVDLIGAILGFGTVTGAETQSEVRRRATREYILEMIEELSLMAFHSGETRLGAELAKILSDEAPAAAQA